MRALDKLDRLGVDAVSDLLGKGRKDESGDFTKGALLPDKAINRVINFTGWDERGSGSASAVGNTAATIANFETAVAGSDVGREGAAELKVIADLVRAAGYGPDRIRIDPSVIRGLEYYTGPVFEAELTFEVKDEEGRPVRFGSVGGGGRYDDLVARFTGERVPATGFSIGVSRLQAAPCVVIQGSDERAKREVTLKDLIEGAKAAAAIKDNKEWKEARPAQVSVKETDLVSEVRKIIARHS
jgi:histidyl-tRNA synthetase